MKGLLILGDFFEDTEALTTRDVLCRAGEKIVTASVMNTLEVKTQYNLSVKCDALLGQINYQDFDYLIIPGGKASFTILDKLTLVEKVIDYFVSNHKLVASICAAPHLLARKGYFKNREFTCYPGFEQFAKDGIYRIDKGVIRDNQFITAKSMFYSIEFALNILAYYYDESFVNDIYLQLKGEK